MSGAEHYLRLRMPGLPTELNGAPRPPLVRYRRLLGLGGDLRDTELDGFFWRDCGHELPMLVSPLVLFLDPLDPLRVGRVRG